MSELEVTKPPFNRSAEVEECVQFLSKAEPGQLLTMTSIGQTIHENPGTQRFYAIVLSARRILLKEKIVFENEKKLGYRRATDSETVAIGAKHTIPSLRRKIRTGLEINGCADFTKLEQSERTTHTYVDATLAAIGMCVKPGNRKKIELAVNSELGKTIDASYILQMVADRKKLLGKDSR